MCVYIEFVKPIFTEIELKILPEVDGLGVQTPLNYRYRIKPSATVNSFKPKALSDEVLAASTTLRGAQFGALWDGRYTALRPQPHAAVCWEVWSGDVNQGSFEI